MIVVLPFVVVVVEVEQLVKAESVSSQSPTLVQVIETEGTSVSESI